MNPIDVLAVLTVVLSALFGLTRGAIHEVLSAIAWIAAIVLTWVSGGWAARMVHDWVAPLAPQMPAVSGDVAGPILIFVAGLCFFLAVGHGIAARLAGGIPGAFSRLVGVVLGVARGAFLLGYAYLQITAVVPVDAAMLREARTLPLIEQSAAIVRRLNLPGVAGGPGQPAPAFPSQPGASGQPGFPGTPGGQPAPAPRPNPAPAPAPAAPGK
jgi:membrane protein required for colicin V production